MNQPQLIRHNPFADNRGFFVKPFSRAVLDSHQIPINFDEFFYSSSKKNVVRGMHFQTAPQATAKLVFVISGAILDVVLDIDFASPNFGQFQIFELKAGENSLFIPKGFAHGFLALEENSVTGYLQEKSYSKEHDEGILWNSFGMDWKVENPIISERDAKFQTLKEYEKKAAAYRR